MSEINLDEYKLHRHIMCIDLKSFYASVECADLGLDPFKVPLVVADKERGGGSICLAVSPYLRAKGVPGRLRIYELPTDEEIIFCKPRMRRYLEASAQVVGVFLKYVSKEDIHIYSVDESFLDFTNYQSLYKMDDIDLARKILDDVYKETKLTATCGIGPNMLLAKLAMDIEAKKTKYQIAKWDYEDVKNKLYNVTPLSKMWGIGPRMEIRLNRMGFYKIGDIANSTPEKLYKAFGILGEELWYHTNGIDMSLIQDKKKIRPKSKSFGISQVLFQDYYRETAPQLILEMCDEISSRLREANKKTKCIHLFIRYNKDHSGGFSHQQTLKTPINLGSDIKNVCLEIFNKWYQDEPIRGIAISATSLCDESAIQLNLFEDVERKVKEEKLFNTIDSIKKRYGKNSIRRASSELEYSTAKLRNEEIGGHHG